MKGSTPILVSVGASFLLLFALQRSCSPFLRIEREAELAARVAVASGLGVADVMALRDLLGVEVSEPELRRRCAEFAAFRGRFGEGLGAVALMGHEALVLDAVAQAGGDAGAAWVAFLPRKESAWGVRFVSVRERFAGRAAASR